MSTSYTHYPAQQLPIYVDVSNLPVLALPGSQAVVSDTDSIYIYDAILGWVLAASGGGGGSVSLTPVGSAPNANAASVSSNVLTLQPASASFPGIVTTLTQSFAGNKTFTGTISASNLSGTNTGDQTITLTGDVTGSGTGSFATTVAKITGTTVSGTTGSGNVVFSASPTLTGTITAALANFSGSVGLSNGLAGAPALFWSSNPTTGLYQAAGSPDTIGFVSTGVERARVDSGGVRIGITNPVVGGKEGLSVAQQINGAPLVDSYGEAVVGIISTNVPNNGTVQGGLYSQSARFISANTSESSTLLGAEVRVRINAGGGSTYTNTGLTGGLRFDSIFLTAGFTTLSGGYAAAIFSADSVATGGNKAFISFSPTLSGGTNNARITDNLSTISGNWFINQSGTDPSTLGGNLFVGGTITGSSNTKIPVTSVSTTYAILSTDDLVLCSAGPYTVTLPTAVGAKGKLYRVKKLDSAFTSIITVATTSSQTIDGVTSTTLNTQYEEVVVVSDGANWQLQSRTYPETWVAYAPTWAGFGTPTLNQTSYRRVGDSLEIRFAIITGTTSATPVQMALPDPSLIINVLSGSLENLGFYSFGPSTANMGTLLASNGTNYINLGYQGGGSGGLSPKNGNSISSGGQLLSGIVTVPIVGWN